MKIRCTMKTYSAELSCRSAEGQAGTPVQWEARALNTGQRSVGGGGGGSRCPAAIFSLAVSNETAQGPRKKGLPLGHPALPEITPETRPQKKHSVHTGTLALDTKF